MGKMIQDNDPGFCCAMTSILARRRAREPLRGWVRFGQMATVLMGLS